jgi:hypothetical protein
MINTLVQYFIQNDHLDLPTIGSLKWVKVEANWQDGVLKAPQESIILDPIEIKPAKQFYNFLADELSISSEQAILQFEQFLNQFNNSSIGQLQFGSLGVLHKKGNEYHWVSNYNAAEFYADIVIETNDNALNVPYWDLEQPAKDNWWIWALIIAITALGIIYFKYN